MGARSIGAGVVINVMRLDRLYITKRMNTWKELALDKKTREIVGVYLGNRR